MFYSISTLLTRNLHDVFVKPLGVMSVTNRAKLRDSQTGRCPSQGSFLRTRFPVSRQKQLSGKMFDYAARFPYDKGRYHILTMSRELAETCVVPAQLEQKLKCEQNDNFQ